MLDVVSRSQRGRVCDYSRNDLRISTPTLVVSDADEPAHISAGPKGRVLHWFGS